MLRRYAIWLHDRTPQHRNSISAEICHFVKMTDLRTYFWSRGDRSLRRKICEDKISLSSYFHVTRNPLELTQKRFISYISIKSRIFLIRQSVSSGLNEDYLTNCEINISKFLKFVVFLWDTL